MALRWATLDRVLRGAAHQFSGGVRIVGRLAHRLRQLLYGAHSAQQFGRLLFDARRRLLVAAGDGVRRIADGVEPDVGFGKRAGACG